VALPPAFLLSAPPAWRTGADPAADGFMPNSEHCSVHGCLMPSLVVTSGALTGQVFSFSDSAVIGRGQFSEVRLNDPTVSRRHALIRSVGTDYELSDQESATARVIAARASPNPY
jgi:hypothetical protein